MDQFRPVTIAGAGQAKRFAQAMRALAFSVIFCIAHPAQAAVVFTGNYSENFDTLAATGTTGTALPSGWMFLETGSGANSSYGVGNGGSTTGNTYSFGAAASTERALGTLASGSISNVQFGVFFTNNTGATITSLDIAYMGEQWRAGNSPDDGLKFSYSLDATSLGTGTWVTVSALDFSPSVLLGNSALNGNANSTNIFATLSGLEIATGQGFAFRWEDSDSTSFDHGLAVDNLSVQSTTAVPEPATWLMLIFGFGFIGGAMRRHRTMGGVPWERR